MAVLAGAQDAQDARTRLQAMLGQQVDGEPGEESGLTFGELLDRGSASPPHGCCPASEESSL
jgi:hypothetical protein